MAKERVEIIFDPILGVETGRRLIKDTEKIGTRAGKKAGKNFNKGFQQGIGKLDLFVANLAARAVTASLTAISNAFRNAAGDVRAFSRGVAEINTILPRNSKLTRESEEALIGLSSQFGTDIQNQARGFYNIVSSGVKGTTAQLRTLAAANKAATAGLVSIDDSAKLLTQSINAYAKSGLTAEEASDQLFIAVREGQTTFGELTQTLGNATGIAAAAGIKFSELTGAVAAFTKTGLQTDVAVTGLRQVMASLLKPTKEATDLAERLGLAFTTTALKAKGFAGFLKDVQVRTGGNSEALAILFGNIRALTPVLTTLNGNFGEFARILKETENSAGATAEAFKIVADSLDFRIQKRTQEIRNFFLIIGKSLVESFGKSFLFLDKNFKDIALSAIATVKVINSTFGRVAETILNIGKVLTSGIRGFGQLIVTIFANVLSGLNKVAKGIAGFLAVFAEPVLIDLGFEGAEGLTQGILNAQSDIEDFAETSRAVLGDIFTEATDAASNIFGDSATQSVDTFFTGLEERLLSTKNFFDLNDPFANLSKNAENAANKTVVSLKKVESASFNAAAAIGGGISNTIQGFVSAVAAGENAIEALGKGILATIGDLAIQLGQFLIIAGIGKQAIQFLPGGAVIAAGIGLVAFGSVLKAFAGGGSGAPSGGGVGVAAAAPIQEQTTFIQEEPEERTTETGITLNIAGDFLDSDEGGLKIVESIQKAFDTQGVVLRTNFA